MEFLQIIIILCLIFGGLTSFISFKVFSKTVSRRFDVHKHAINTLIDISNEKLDTSLTHIDT